MRIPPDVSEWLNLLARWFHVFAGILWVGSTYYFTWLDGRFQEAEREAGEGRDSAEVWMVHSGGFYVVHKKKTPGGRELHWFRWEAALTWLSGVFLLVLLYYLGGGMVDVDVRDISVTTAVLFGVGMILVGGFVYDVLVRTPLAKNEKAFAAVAYALVVGAAYLATRVLSGRAAFLHLGAMFGTIMVANVWMHILPAQRRMIAAAREGRTPDARDAALAKLRSKHNTFMAVPVVFTMISNHYPVSTYGHQYNWLILSALVLAGWVAAKIIRRA
jgi:uncharacterized membrane protein